MYIKIALLFPSITQKLHHYETQDCLGEESQSLDGTRALHQYQAPHDYTHNPASIRPSTMPHAPLSSSLPPRTEAAAEPLTLWAQAASCRA